MTTMHICGPDGCDRFEVDWLGLRAAAKSFHLQLWLDAHDAEAKRLHAAGEPSGYSAATDSCECDLCNHVEAQIDAIHETNNARG